MNRILIITGIILCLTCGLFAADHRLDRKRVYDAEKSEKLTIFFDTVFRQDTYLLYGEQIQYMQRLLKEGASPYIKNGVLVFTALEEMERDDLLQSLLNAGLDPNAKYSNRKRERFPLECASRVSAAKLLIAAGADPRVKINTCGINDCRDTLMHQFCNRSVMGWESGLLKEYVNHGVDPHASTCEGDTLLHLLFRSTRFFVDYKRDFIDKDLMEKVNILFELNCVLAQKNKHGKTPLEVLKEHWPELVNEMIDAYEGVQERTKPSRAQIQKLLASYLPVSPDQNLAQLVMQYARLRVVPLDDISEETQSKGKGCCVLQ